MIKIVQVQISIESGARSAIRLQNAFITEGISSNIVSLLVSPHQLKNVFYLGKTEMLTSMLDGKMQRSVVKYNKKDYGLFSYPVLGSDISQHPEVQQADIIYLHWVWEDFSILEVIIKSLHWESRLSLFCMTCGQYPADVIIVLPVRNIRLNAPIARCFPVIPQMTMRRKDFGKNQRFIPGLRICILWLQAGGYITVQRKPN